MSKKNIFFYSIISIILFSYSTAINIDSLINLFKSFLQKNVSNKELLKFLQMFGSLSAKAYPGNLEHNIKNFQNHLATINENNGYIEDQRNYGDMKFGLETISFSGCEIIATYNALYDLTGKHNIDFPAMIDYFEKDGILLYGYFGTAPQALEEYLNKLGFETMTSTEKEDYYYIQEACDAFILTIYNDKDDITKMIHTIAISKRNKKYYVHNNGYYGHLEEYDSILDILSKINDGKAKDIFLIGIKKN